MGLFDKINEFFSNRSHAQTHLKAELDDNEPTSGEGNDHATSLGQITTETAWPSHQGFALDANHSIPNDALTANAWKELQEEIAAYETREFDTEYIDEDLAELDDEKYDYDVITLPAGTILMRYGDEHGTFLTDPGTSISQVALPLDRYEAHYYILTEPLDVHAGTARPWFGKEGGGAQYKTLEGKSPLDLLESGAFRRCNADGSPLENVDKATLSENIPEAHASFQQNVGQRIKGSISDFVQNHFKAILAGCVVINVLTGAHQLDIDLKKAEAEIEPTVKIEQVNDAIDNFRDKIADDDIAAVLETINKEDGEIHEPLHSLVIDDKPPALFESDDDNPPPPDGGEGGGDNPPPPPDGGESGNDNPPPPPPDKIDDGNDDNHNNDSQDRNDASPSPDGSDRNDVADIVAQPILGEHLAVSATQPDEEIKRAQSFSSYADRIKHTPSAESGRWSGERGESLCSAKSAEAQNILAEKGLSGIEYRDGTPDFSPFSLSTVQLGYMTDSRHSSGTDGRDSQNTIYVHFDANGEVESRSHRAEKDSMADLHMKYDKPGNFDQADILTAENWNDEKKDGHDWTAKDVADYRRSNNLTWHECNDGTTMMMIPEVINAEFGHLGGVSEIKARDALIEQTIQGTEFDVDQVDGDPTAGMSDAEVTEYYEGLWAEQDRYSEGRSLEPEATASQQDPVEALAGYYNEHGYGPDDAAEYQQDPEWQRLQKAAYPDYEIPNGEAAVSSRTETVDASTISGVDTSDEHFWDHHGNTKEEYLAIASKLPEVQEQLAQGKTLDEIKENPDLHDCAVAYYDPAHMVKVEQTENGLEFRDDGRHRIAAAQELGLQVPVQVIDRNPETSAETKGEAIPITAEQQAAAFNALNKYMNDHDYGREDYAEYSQDPEWQALHDAAYGHPVIESTESSDPETDRRLEELYEQSREASTECSDNVEQKENPENGEKQFSNSKNGVDESGLSENNGDQPENPEKNGDQPENPEKNGDQPENPENSGDQPENPESNGDQPPKPEDNGNQAEKPDDDIQEELSDISGDYEQLVIDGFEGSDISEELSSTENIESAESTLIEDPSSIDLQNELGDNSEIDGQMSFDDLNIPADVDLNNELNDKTDSHDIDNIDAGIDVSELEGEVKSEDDDYEQLSIEGFNDEELEAIGSEETMDGLDAENDTRSTEQIDGQMSIDDMSSSVDSSSLDSGGGDGGVS